MNFLGYEKFSRLMEKGSKHTASRGYFYEVYFKCNSGSTYRLPDRLVSSHWEQNKNGILYKFGPNTCFIDHI